MLYLAGIAISFFLAFILLSKRNKSDADKLLAAWLFFIGVHLSLYYLTITRKYILYPYLLGFELPLPLVHAPFLYLYTASLTNLNTNKKYRLFHFIPALLVYLLFADFFTLSFAEKIKVYEQEGIAYRTQLDIIFIGIIVSGISYILLSLLLLRKHRSNIVLLFSSSEKINLNWLRYLIIGLSLIWAAVIFGNDTLIFSSTVLFVIFIGYFGIKQVGIFTQESKSKPTIPVVELAIEKDEEIKLNLLPEQVREKGAEETGLNVIKYQKSGLTETTIQEIHLQLTQVMIAEKLYTNPDLTLSELAEKLNVQPNNLSQVINSVEKKNFYDYINYHRIEEFKNKVALPESNKFTLLSLAFECGFNSKTSFNRNFKKVTNLSPSEYLNQQKIHLM